MRKTLKKNYKKPLRNKKNRQSEKEKNYQNKQKLEDKQLLTKQNRLQRDKNLLLILKRDVKMIF